MKFVKVVQVLGCADSPHTIKMKSLNFLSSLDGLIENWADIKLVIKPDILFYHFEEHCLVLRGEFGCGVIPVRQLHRGIDEGASAEARRLKPFFQRGEKGRQRLDSRLDSPFDRRGEEAVDSLFPMLEDRQDKVVLGGEVVVQGHLGDFRLRNDPIDSDGADPLGVKQPFGGLHDSLAGS